MIIDGYAIAAQKRAALKQQIEDQNLTPRLDIILANNNAASRIYIDRKIKACEEVGITATLHEFDDTVTSDQIENLINNLNTQTDGLFLQLPLFDHLNAQTLINMIDPAKDVDGLTHINLGKVISGDDTDLTPCTPQGVMHLLKHMHDDLSGKHAVIIGRSLLFGKPMGQLLLHADCTVTHCHSKTKNLSAIAAQADILIAATGQAKMIKADWVKDGATIIDVGISELPDGTISGDVDFEAVKSKAAHITPVPGGVGPMTVACLLANTVKSAQT